MNESSFFVDQLIRNSSLPMAPAKDTPMEAILKKHSNREFATRPPELIPMVSYMNDHKKIDFPAKISGSGGAILNEPPFSSSTLLKGLRKRLPVETGAENEEQCDFEEDSLEDLTAHIHHLHASDEDEAVGENKNEAAITMEEEEITITNSSSQDPIPQQDMANSSTPNETRCSRKLPPTPRLLIPLNTPSTNEDVKRKELAHHKSKRRMCSRTFSLPSSPFNTRRSQDGKKDSPALKRNAYSLRDKLRQSLKRKEPFQCSIEENPFPDERENRMYRSAKKRGRRGAVVSLEVNQTVSLVKSVSGEDKFLEFSFVPSRDG